MNEETIDVIDGLNYRTPRRGLALSIGLLSALVLAGCGGGGSGEASVNSVSKPEATTAAAGERSQTLAVAAAAEMSLLSFVNPFVGTKIGNPNPDNQGTGGAIGNTFPGATLPFGMVQFSPDTGYGETNGYGGYQYDKGVIQGISLTHSSGTGCSVTQDLPMLPIVGDVVASPATNLGNYQVGFSHANETAQPGYYRVGLNNGVNTELTVTKRTGFGRFTYPTTNQATMIFNTGRDGVGARSAQIEIIGSDSVQGFVESPGVCGGGAYKAYFHAQFDRNFASFGTYRDGTLFPNSRASTVNKGVGGWVKFASGGQMKVRVGVSFVSTANAKLNMQTENANWDFDGIKNAAQATWNTLLNKVQITGGSTEEKTKFYTALYHSLLHPNLFSDVNGQYIGFDNKIYTATNFNKYATYSGWDIYRSQVQLVAWLAPQEASDMAQSMVVDAETGGGGYPKWATMNDDSCVMVGDPGAAIVANYYAFGGKNFDTAKALRFMEQGATQSGTKSRGCTTRPSLTDYLTRGYIPISTSGLWGAAATAEEYAVADSAIAQFAGALGDTAKRDKYHAQAQMWKPLFSNFSGYIHPRTTGGGFADGFSRTSGSGFVEGDSAQYTWMVPHNFRGLFDHMGGNAAAIARLDEHFTKLDAGPNSEFAFMGNEPEHSTPWAYIFAGAPYKSQSVIRRIQNELYKTGPDGLTGNDDLGASSAWFVWSALGLYPEIPGLGGFVIGSPLFPGINVQMGNGRTLAITAANAGAGGTYIQSLNLNGQATTRTWLPLTQLAADSKLDFVLGSTANTAWGSAAADAPPSFDAPRVTTTATSFFTDFESGVSQPDYNDTVDFQSNVTGYLGSLSHMETSTRRENVAKSGATALLYSGTDNSATGSFSYNKVFDVRIAVSSTTTLSYWINPQSADPNSSYVAVDLIFTDGSSLRDSGATDQRGVRVHPEFQGRGGQLVGNTWNEVRSNIGQWAAGKTISRILVAYDRPDATGKFRGFIDDIRISAP